METRRTVIDTRGYSCPIPLAMVSRKMHSLKEGETLEVLFDDAAFRKELEAWCAETGMPLLIMKMRKPLSGSGREGRRIQEKGDAGFHQVHTARR